MIAYDTVATALENVIKHVFGASVDVYWMNSSEDAGWIRSPAFALHLRSEQGKGIDTERATGNPVPAELQEPAVAAHESADYMKQVEGQRMLVWVVRCETESQHPLSESSRAYLSQLRTALRSTPVRNILRAANIGLSRLDPAVDLDYEFDGRMLSASSMDVILMTTAQGTEFGAQEIRKVTITDTIPDPDSTFEVDKP